MIFIPLTNVLIISIILMMMISFLNSSQIKPTFYQLVDHKTDKSYDIYYSRSKRNYEMKMTVYQYYNTIHNINAKRIPSLNVKSFDIYEKELVDYCSENYNYPELETKNYYSTFFKNLFTNLFKCLVVLKKGVAELNEKNGIKKQEQLPTSADIENSSKFNTKIKKKILDFDKIDLLRSFTDNDNNKENMTIINDFIDDWFKENKIIDEPKNDHESTCITNIKIMNKLEFRATKLSYIIYPNSLENNLNRYKGKRYNIRV
ncbi:uncharacterized protein LOC112599228 [Melanaphis sacchari]|uniref:uncharacterized protein LOC112599228 n=1 Tax=Melanaphis sacchari TaxID=742174 RepID=UPI000DC15917|nr:uncharacterized protein LOC112599228 [Melanaphis sacchari]